MRDAEEFGRRDREKVRGEGGESSRGGGGGGDRGRERQRWRRAGERRGDGRRKRLVRRRQSGE